MEIVFTFADGRLAHDCQRCGGRCCQLDGFALPTSELKTLLEHDPTLALFARATRTAQFYALRGIGGRCPMLEDDGLCRAHGQLGYAAKPYVCKLYPANQLYLLGETLLVDLHPDCPLERVENTGPAALRLEHAALRETLLHYEAIVRSRSATLEARQEGATALIAAGCGVRDLMAQYANESVLDLATKLSEAHGGESRASLTAFAEQLVLFLRGERSSATRLKSESDPDLALTLPRQFFFALAAEALPPFSQLLGLLPRITIVLAFFAQQRRQSGPLEPGIQAAHTLCSENLDLALWLAHLDRVPRFCEEPDALPLALGALKNIKRLISFIYQQHEGAGLQLGAICGRIGLDDRLSRITTLAALPPSLWRALRFDQA